MRLFKASVVAILMAVCNVSTAQVPQAVTGVTGAVRGLEGLLAGERGAQALAALGVAGANNMNLQQRVAAAQRLASQNDDVARALNGRVAARDALLAQGKSADEATRLALAPGNELYTVAASVRELQAGREAVRASNADEIRAVLREQVAAGKMTREEAASMLSARAAANAKMGEEAVIGERAAECYRTFVSEAAIQNMTELFKGIATGITEDTSIARATTEAQKAALAEKGAEGGIVVSMQKFRKDRLAAAGWVCDLGQQCQIPAQRVAAAACRVAGR